MANAGTLKQIHIRQFFVALENYKQALINGSSEAIVASSIELRILRSHVPKSLHPEINRTFREFGRQVPPENHTLPGEINTQPETKVEGK
jgi:hypothetical protein